MSSLGKRRETDLFKLMMSDFKVETKDDRIDEFNVEFLGPKDSPYEGGVWKLHVQLPVEYPYKPPIIKFTNKIFHPNINEDSGAICLDVMDKLWSSLSDHCKLFLPHFDFTHAHPGNFPEVTHSKTTPSGVLLQGQSEKKKVHFVDLVNVFEIYLPQLLLYPNKDHGLNHEAIFLLMTDEKKYVQKAKDYRDKYARKEDVIGTCSGVEISDEDLSETEVGPSDDESADGAVICHLEL